eukprot:4618493-Pyramimonas_sp.AAC.1
MQNFKPDLDARTHRTLGYISCRGEALVRLTVGSNADVPTKLQWSQAANRHGISEDVQKQIAAEFISNFADPLSAAQWL